MFDSLLIANRGEIACRIIRTARRMGLRTVAVFSDADADAPHVQMADRAVHIGPPPATDSYLRADRILDAARKTGAQAIHPGYGFLSEQAELVRGCAELGITWVGPHLEAITAMGDKIAAKRIAQAAGVPCIPGYAGGDQSDATLIAAAREIGLPVMIKASAGGGGKGMRAVQDAADLPAAIATARAEAERAFGDRRLLVEKLVQNPRHVEVQILGDKHGTLLHLFERDCSVQRNHQKLLEEAPAPNLRDDTRAALHDAALRLGRQIGYDSAGTVEFIMDAETEAFHFLEMNTRLQVEHTVTEEITGLDLVELQLRAAAGERLPLAQSDIACTGHAIEARLTAEDASDGFRPRTGTLLHWAPPPGLRTDAGVRAGSVIESHYDSMIAKLIARGHDRDTARKALVAGLEQLGTAGVTTNRLFLRDALLTETFAQGPATTDFVAREWPEGWTPPTRDSLALAALACHTRPRDAATPWQTLGGFRLLQAAGHPARTAYLDARQPETRVTLATTPQGIAVTDDAGTWTAEARWTGPASVTVTRDGVAETFGAAIEDGIVHVWGEDFDAAHEIVALGDFDAARSSKDAAAPDRITAPMPGLIVDLPARPGDAVDAGDTLVVMESMKLLMELKAAAPGTVAGVTGARGETVEAGTLLVQLDLTRERD